MTRHVTRPAPVCPAQTTYPGTFTRGQLRNPGLGEEHESDGKGRAGQQKPAVSGHDASTAMGEFSTGCRRERAGGRKIRRSTARVRYSDTVGPITCDVVLAPYPGRGRPSDRRRRCYRASSIFAVLRPSRTLCIRDRGSGVGRECLRASPDSEARPPTATRPAALRPMCGRSRTRFFADVSTGVDPVRSPDEGPAPGRSPPHRRPS